MLLLSAIDFAFYKSVLLCAIALGMIIFIHELGHFLVAKACGVRCDKFYIGFDFFGLKLLKFKYGETEYGIGVFPLGGYVKMLGQEDNPGETRERVNKAKAARELLEKNADAEVDQAILMSEEEIAEAEKLINDPRSYQSKTVPQRMAIIVAGVAMNVVLAFVAAVLAYMLGVSKLPCELGGVHPGQAAWEAGLQSDDTLEKIGNADVKYFDDISKHVALGSNLENGLEVVFHRDGMPLNASQAAKVYPKKSALSPMLGATNAVTPVLMSVMPASPTFVAGAELKAGDVLVGINDREIRTNLDYEKAMYATTGENAILKFVRPSLEAQKKRWEALRDLEIGDYAGRATIENELRQGGEAVEVMVEPLHARHFGVVLTMGNVQAIRSSENGLEGAGKAGIKPGDKIVGLEIMTENGLQMIRDLDPVTLPWLVKRETKRVVALAAENVGTVPALNFAVLKADAKTEEVVAVEVSQNVFSSDNYFFGCGELLPEIGLTYEILPVVSAVIPGSEAEKQGVKPNFVLKSVALAYSEDKEAELTEKSKRIAESFSKPTEHVFKEGVSSWTVLYHHFMLRYPIKGTSAIVVFADPSKDTNNEMTAKLALQEYADAFVYHSDLVFESKQIYIKEGIVGALALGGKETWNALTVVFRTLGKLGNGQVSVKGLGGPVLIAKVAYSAAREGLSKLLIFVCLISANLAVLNLLPIPVLDGGHVVFLLWEGITGKAPNENLVIILSYLGLLLFLGLTIFVFGLDLGFIPRF